MKIFLLTKKTLICYVALFALSLSLFISGTNISVSVMNSADVERLLPIYCVDRGEEKLCSITFDAAWDDSDTDRLISILEKYNAKATFFMVGSWVEKYPESVKKFFSAGHEIMNHSDTHPHINQLSEEKIKEEINRCSDKIEALVGKRPDLFRGPYGEYNDAVIRAAEILGHKTIQWDVDSLDWKELATDDIVSRVTKRVKPGSIVLFHNGVKNTPEALEKILDHLTKDGYKIIPVGELIHRDNYTIDHQGKQILNQNEQNEPAESES
ncbi:MAG: polysaccharide deacetylase family protein [Clostridia bacterium]|nr:polysaccharide deacetylase family protein [Clostridia bacterium]